MKKLPLFFMILISFFLFACGDRTDKSSMYPEYKPICSYNVPKEKIYELAMKYNLTDPNLINYFYSNGKTKNSNSLTGLLDSAVITCFPEKEIERYLKNIREELDALSKYLNTLWQHHRELASAKTVREALIYHYSKHYPESTIKEFGSEANFYKYLDSIYVVKNINFYVVNADSSLAIIPQEFDEGTFPGRLIKY